MKARRKAARTPGGVRSFKFDHERPQNSLRVEYGPSGVTIRAARDNFSPRDRTFFVQYLASEGFIPQWYRRSAVEQTGAGTGLEWIVEDCSNAACASPGATRRAKAFMIRLFAYEVLAWMTQLTALCLTVRY